jgi:predicted nuclease of predicted toxin-antitoxin system
VRLLFDQNISNRLIAKIIHLFPEAKQVKELALENYTDRQIWEYAKIEKFTIATFDSDFYDLSTLYGHPPKIVWLRLGNISTNDLFSYLESKYRTIIEFIEDETNQDISCLELIH